MSLFAADWLIPDLEECRVTYTKNLVRVSVPSSEVKGHVALKQGDLSPDLAIELQEADGRSFNLEGWTNPRIYMRPAVAGALKIDAGAATVAGSGAVGVVVYAWDALDVDTPGGYILELEVTDPSGKPRRFPSDTYIPVKISPRLE